MSTDIIQSAFDLLTTHVIIDLTSGYDTVLKTDGKILIHSDREISMVEKKTSQHLTKSTGGRTIVKAHDHKWKYRGFTTRCTPLLIYENRKTKLGFVRKKCKRHCAVLKRSPFLHYNDAKRKVHL